MKLTIADDLPDLDPIILTPILSLSRLAPAVSDLALGLSIFKREVRLPGLNALVFECVDLSLCHKKKMINLFCFGLSQIVNDNSVRAALWLNSSEGQLGDECVNARDGLLVSAAGQLFLAQAGFLINVQDKPLHISSSDARTHLFAIHEMRFA